jgi:hypothetical protein
LLSTPEEALLKIINEIIDEMIDSDIDKAKQDKIKKTASTIFKGALRVGGAMINSKIGDITDELLETKGNSIRQLRENLNSLADEVMNRTTNPYRKIVIYVDDLDRIEPKEAVKILELLKNIFSINGCVFVLAIDYQVVVKGLEDKFGKRTEENEWEFRAFFDKIIQLPFMMPMGQYNIGKYVGTLLNQVGFLQNNEIDENTIDNIISYSIGGNPRSLKRLVNSLSLIAIFLKVQNNQNKDILTNKNKKTLLFALVCMQIAYPAIYEFMSKNPNYIEWDSDLAYSYTKLKEEEDKEKFDKEFSNIQKTDEFDEEWEQTLFRVCYITPRYHKRVIEISKLLNFIKDDILENEKEDLETIIAEVISETSVTSVSVTDDTQTNTKKHQKIKYETFESYKENVLIKQNINTNTIAFIEEMINILNESLDKKCIIKYSPSFIGLNIDTSARVKIFCGIHIRKKYITLNHIYLNEMDLKEIWGNQFENLKDKYTIKNLNDELTRWEIKKITTIEEFEEHFLPILIRSCDKFLEDYKK